MLLNDKSIISIQCAGFENLAKADLEMSLSSSASQRYVTSSFSSRFVVGSLAFLVTVLINYAFTKYYLESFVCDKISEFVDFCSVSNVSTTDFLSAAVFPRNRPILGHNQKSSGRAR